MVVEIFKRRRLFNFLNHHLDDICFSHLWHIYGKKLYLSRSLLDKVWIFMYVAKLNLEKIRLYIYRKHRINKTKNNNTTTSGSRQQIDIR